MPHVSTGYKEKEKGTRKEGREGEKGRREEEMRERKGKGVKGKVMGGKGKDFRRPLLAWWCKD